MLFVVAIAFAVACAAIAGNKGRSVIAWALLGLCFGPLALIVVAVISRNEEQATRSGLQSGQLRRCPYCAETVRAEASKCKHCGSMLPPPPQRDIWGRVKD